MGERAAITLRAEPLTAQAWEPFGWLPVSDADSTDSDHDLEFAWADPHVNVISHTRGEVDYTDDGVVCGVMYRHDTHTQTLMALNCDAIVAVAPAAVDFTRPGDLDTIRAFVLHPLDALVLHRGTWHWGPFPLNAEVVQLFNVQGARYAEDNTSVDLEERGGPIEVVIP